jgi:hypothetical protein
MNIYIHDSQQNDKVVAKIPIVLGSLNYNPSESECFDAAWLVAIEDGLVQADNRLRYYFFSAEN